MITRVAVFRHPSAASVSDVLRHFQPDVVQTEPSVDVTDVIGTSARLLPVFHDSQDLAQRVASYTTDRAPGDAVLLEAPGRGGRGEPPSWERAADVARITPLVLAGGLAPHNVVDAILKVRPHAVDVSSGVESKPGIKDPGLIAQFIEAARQAERQMDTPTELPR
jgi:phosphoribosylanthranilate isomerase